MLTEEQYMKQCKKLLKTKLVALKYGDLKRAKKAEDDFKALVEKHRQELIAFREQVKRVNEQKNITPLYTNIILPNG